MGGKWGPKVFLLKKNSGKTIREEKIEKTFSLFLVFFWSIYVSLKIEKRSKTVKIPDFRHVFTVMTLCSIRKNSFLRRIRNQHPGKPRNPFFIDLCIVKNRKTVKNGQKTSFYGREFNCFDRFEQHNLKKHDAWKHPKVKGTHDPTKIRFFCYFFQNL